MVKIQYGESCRPSKKREFASFTLLLRNLFQVTNKDQVQFVIVPKRNGQSGEGQIWEKLILIGVSYKVRLQMRSAIETCLITCCPYLFGLSALKCSKKCSCIYDERFWDV